MAKRYEDINGKNRPTASGKHQAAREFMEKKTASEQPDWGRIEDRLLWTVIQKVTVDDGAILFGYSRDGGAYTVKVYGGSEPWVTYAHSDAEITEFLIGLIEVYNG